MWKSLLSLRVQSLRRSCALYHAKTGVYGYKIWQESDEGEEVRPACTAESSGSVQQLVDAYRRYGHRKGFAATDPLKLIPLRDQPELDPRKYGLSADSGAALPVEGILHTGAQNLPLSELVRQLESLYCGSLTAEFQHLQTEEEREWFARAFESRHSYSLDNERKTKLAQLLLKCQAFDNFLAAKFTTVKRYGGEGGESMMGVFDEIFRKSVQGGVTDIVMCMPHRGRLNFLTCMLKFPPVVMFRKMKGLSELPPNAQGSGDVLSHLYTSVDLDYGGQSVHVSLIPNPSHLEANNPVAVGKTRAKQQQVGEGDYSQDSAQHPGDKVLCVQVHGDASFIGQGVVAETFCFAECPHFRVGGSIHLIVNNQVGYTTEAPYGRSSQYTSDLAKVNGYPVLRVNGDNPEEVVQAAAIAMDYRQLFRRDVVIDLICYRRWGHNELDEPSFTQPIMYNVINNRPSVPDLYADNLVKSSICSGEELSKSVQEWTAKLSSELSLVDSHTVQPFHLLKQWSSMQQASKNITTWDTGIPVDILKFVGAKSVDVPSTVVVHPTIHKTHIDRRRQRLEAGTDLDWATAEALAVGSLLYQGFNVRISGQDVGRGTFSQRHAMIVDQRSDDIFIPLNHMLPNQTAFFEVANSVLSEEGVLGFEYGMSLEHPNNLVIWEAQFGDFFNGAQPIIDTYITSGELKWLLQSGMVMLLPHGMDGAGPEHSSCRLERFLQMCDSSEDRVDGDNVNFQIAHPTTPAQYFHLLRRQMVRNFRKPLVVASPKLILRHPSATSDLSDMGPGTSFQPVLGDSGVEPGQVTRLVFCSGKHFYALQKERETRGIRNTAFIRLEALCPFPAEELRKEIKKYSKAKEFIWSQEEHRNMGAWTFVSSRFENIVGHKLQYAGRDVLGTPAVGIGQVHSQEVKEILEAALKK